jgi:hypothetical protein
MAALLAPLLRAAGGLEEALRLLNDPGTTNEQRKQAAGRLGFGYEAATVVMDPALQQGASAMVMMSRSYMPRLVTGTATAPMEEHSRDVGHKREEELEFLTQFLPQGQWDPNPAVRRAAGAALIQLATLLGWPGDQTAWPSLASGLLDGTSNQGNDHQALGKLAFVASLVAAGLLTPRDDGAVHTILNGLQAVVAAAQPNSDPTATVRS